MRILVLTLMMSFLSHSAFGAAAEGGGGAKAKKRRTAKKYTNTSSFSNLPNDLLSEVGAYLSEEEVAAISKSNPLLKGSRETM